VRTGGLNAWGLAGVAAGALGVYFAFDGGWPAALACFAGSALLLWLGGVWVLPWSRAAYLRRVQSAWTDWEAAAQAAYGVFSRRRSRLAARLEQLSPPPELAGEHARLMALFTESERLTGDESVPYPERARLVVTALHSVDEAAKRLAGTAATDAQRRYVAALEELRNERDAEYAAATRKAEQAGEEVVNGLTRVRAPSAAAAVHGTMVEAFRGYLAAARAFHAAAGSHEPDRAATAAHEAEAAAQRLHGACAAVSLRVAS
jgi:hypothetical protein